MDNKEIKKKIIINTKELAKNALKKQFTTQKAIKLENKRKFIDEEYNDSHKFIVMEITNNKICRVSRKSDLIEFSIGEKIISKNGHSSHIIHEFIRKQRQFGHGIAYNSGIDEIWVVYTKAQGGNWLSEINHYVEVKQIDLTKNKPQEKPEKIKKIKQPKSGKKYKHYKGGLYKVMFCSKHTETDEILVNYKSLKSGKYHSKPLSIWNELTENGKKQFKLKK